MRGSSSPKQPRGDSLGAEQPGQLSPAQGTRAQGTGCGAGRGGGGGGALRTANGSGSSPYPSVLLKGVFLTVPSIGRKGTILLAQPHSLNTCLPEGE